MEDRLEIEQPEQSGNLLKFLSKVLRNWYWVAGSLVLCMLMAYLIIRYEDPIYLVRSSFVTKKFDEGNSGTLGGIIDGSLFRQRIEVFQEIPLLKSEAKIRETLNRLDFDVSYFVVGRFKTSEVYSDYIYSVEYDSSSYIPYGKPIYIETEDEDESRYRLYSEDDELNKSLGDKVRLFGRDQDINGWRFTIRRTGKPHGENGYSYYFVINHPDALLEEYTQKLQISWQQQGSAILDGVIQSKIPQKDIRFITTYLDVVIEKGLEEKNQHLVNTIEFINDYMDQLSDTLLHYQDRIDQFRIENSDVVSGSEIVFTKLATLDQEKSTLLLENRYFDYITRYVREKKQEEVFAPNLLGIDAPLLSQLVGQYVDIKWTDKIDLNENNKMNPLVTKENEEYVRVEKNLFESIRTRRQANEERIQEINVETAKFYSSLTDLQIQSRKYDELKRMLMLYQSTVDVLLSKRTDASIAKASTTSDYQIVTSPSYGTIPIYPNQNKIFIVAALAGLGLPLGILYLSMMLNEKIISRDDLKKHTTIPLIGSIGHSKARSNKVILEQPKSNVSESFRGIRANLQYFVPAGSSSTVYLITSSISSEGKTFCSVNLAYTFALTGKKTILLGADMRKPSLSRIFELRNEKGLSQYLAQMASLEEVIYPTEMESFFLLPGGVVPPNPSELLSSRQMEVLIQELRKSFEIIIIDTPPIGLVADTLELIKLSDVNLLIVRQGRTFKKSLDAITELYNEGKVTKLGILFNDIDFTKYEYGKGYGYGNKYGYAYGYGYGYYAEDDDSRGWWRRLLRLKVRK